MRMKWKIYLKKYNSWILTGYEEKYQLLNPGSATSPSWINTRKNIARHNRGKLLKKQRRRDTLEIAPAVWLWWWWRLHIRKQPCGLSDLFVKQLKPEDNGASSKCWKKIILSPRTLCPVKTSLKNKNEMQRYLNSLKQKEFYTCRFKERWRIMADGCPAL